MMRRIIVTVVLLLFAVGGFCGAAPAAVGPLNPFGWLFVGLAVLVWFKWGIITGTFSPALFDGMCARNGDGFRADDDHYRRDAPRDYREPQ
ncbi:MAG: hypothetical protein WA417_17735 [Stellaceae bacterium]